MGIETIFTNVIHTVNQHKNVQLRPLFLKTDVKNAIKRIRKVFQENDFANIWAKEEYGEIYGEQYPYEISCHLLEDGAHLICHIMVYNNEGLKKKKELLYIKELLRQNLKDILDTAE